MALATVTTASMGPGEAVSPTGRGQRWPQRPCSAADSSEATLHDPSGEMAYLLKAGD